MWRPLKILTLLAVCLYSLAEAKSKLNVPRILLPIFREISTSYTLEVTPGIGCYRWSTSRSDLIQVVLEDPHGDCSVNATVIVKTTELMRNTAIVLAEEVDTNEVLRADVIIDVIHSLNIVTTTRELYMEEPPEMFEVRAYDDQGNEFTTLKGVEFKWNIEGMAVDHQPVLKFITFRDSLYETPSTIVNFEKDKQQGHIVLIEGVTTGSARVSVHLPYPEYSHVKLVEVSLVVIVNLILEPVESFILKGDTITYRLLQVKQSRLIEVDPSVSSQYEIQGDSDNLVEIREFTVTGTDLGVVKISLQEKNSEIDTPKLPSSQLTICEPFHINLVMYPIDNWMLVTGSYAVITAELFTRDHHRIHLGPNVEIMITVPPKLFHIERRSKNGSVVYGYGGDSGYDSVKAAVNPLSIGFSEIGPRHNLTTSVTLNVFPRLTLFPEVLFVPWNPTMPRLKVSYVASGGDGVYTWKTGASSVATVLENGVVETRGIGTTCVTVSMTVDPTKFTQAKLYVVEPIAMEIIPYINEVVVGSPVYIHISLSGHYEGTLTPLDYCDHFAYKVEVADNFYYDNSLKQKPKVKNACTVLSIVGKQPGVSKLRVSLRINGIELTSSTLISAFEPLTVNYPKEGKPVVLALGSSSPIVFQNGPNHNFGRVIPSIKYSKQLLTHHDIIERHQLYIFSVMCVNLGETTFKLELKSEPVLKLCKGVIVEAYVTVICAHPRIISLEPSLPSTCSLASTNFVFCQISSKYEWNVILKDDKGNDFDNATSLLFEWIPDKADLISIEKKSPIQLHEVSMYPDVAIPNGHYKMLLTKNKTGQTELRTKLVGFQKSAVNFLNKIYDDYENLLKTIPVLVGKLPVKIVHQITTDPQTISLFTHPNVRAEINISNGSGHIDIAVSPKGLISYTKHGNMIEVKPIQEGSAVLSVKDNCILNTSALVDIKIVELKMIKLEVVEKVVKDTIFTATVSFHGKDNERLTFPPTTMVELVTHLSISSPNIIKLEGVETGEIDYSAGSIMFKLKSLNHGESTLVAKCLDLFSESHIVQVFPSVKISPQSLVLCVGAEIQISVTGGPSHPSRDIQFSVIDNYIVSVDNVGVIKGLHIGKTQVKAMAFNALSEIFSEDSIEVSVIPLSGIRLIAPVSNLLVGNVMPVWVTGVPSQLTPFVIGSINPPLHFQWSVSLPSVLQIYNVFQDANLKLDHDNSLSMRVKALKPGHSHIHVAVSGHSWDGSFIVLNSTIEIQVLSSFHWENPNFVSIPSIIVAPDSQFNIKTNRDLEGPINYRIINLSNSSHRSVTSREFRAENYGVSLVDSFSGRVHVNSQKGNSVIVASYKDYLGELQIISLNVMIRPVHYIMLNIQNKILSPNVLLHSLPQGLYLKLSVTYHDQFGTPFYAAPTQIDAQFNVFDKTNISPHGKDELEITLEKEGNTTLRIYDIIGGFEDYIKLPVRNHIFPSKKTLALDEIVCYTTMGNFNGTWHSDSDTVKIDEYGLAVPMRQGSAVLSFKSVQAGAYISSYLPVEIFPTEMLQLGPLPQNVISNSVEGEVFFVPVLFGTVKNLEEPVKYMPTPCNVNSEVPKFLAFRCEIRFNTLQTSYPIEHLFAVQAKFDFNSGYYGCEIFTLTGPTYNTSIIMANISIRANYYNPTVSPDSLLIHYVPSVFVLHRRIYFEKDVNEKSLFISGIPEVLSQITVDVNNRLLYIVGNPTCDMSRKQCEYKIFIDFFYWKGVKTYEDDYVIISSPLTKQLIKIPLLVDDELDEQTLPQIKDPLKRLILPLITTEERFEDIMYYGLWLLAIFTPLCISYFIFFFTEQSPAALYRLYNTIPNRPIRVPAGFDTPHDLISESLSQYVRPGRRTSPERKQFSYGNTRNLNDSLFMSSGSSEF
ncbi:nuclear pore membrane glycoprotein 210 [Cimex lectularius]|uniref:BIG2 domain-containing protein n=1 Tax=Cimex lectularius TaxID=79782 RepID=A0A8I6S595_CIMLE|nr:nuclear pore membrane glycoprotein 210 [Cimex lectularius]